MMNTKIVGLRVAGTIFGFVAIAHILRITSGVSVIVAGWNIPLWINIIGFIGTAFLCVWLWLLSVSRDR
jgi:hypothetical protein